MTEVVRYWRVTFKTNGTVRAVKPLNGPGHDRWVVVQAADEKEAQHKAYNVYCARKKRERRTTLRAAGQCVCGRKQDRLLVGGPRSRKGGLALTCSVCAARRQGHHLNAKAHPGRTFVQAMAERDESARVASNQDRQRDRRAELRIEVLLEVRRQWQRVPTGAFTRWLEDEIKALTQKGVAA